MAIIETTAENGRCVGYNAKENVKSVNNCVSPAKCVRILFRTLYVVEFTVFSISRFMLHLSCSDFESMFSQRSLISQLLWGRKSPEK